MDNYIQTRISILRSLHGIACALYYEQEKDSDDLWIFSNFVYAPDTAKLAATAFDISEMRKTYYMFFKLLLNKCSDGRADKFKNCLGNLQNLFIHMNFLMTLFDRKSVERTAWENAKRTADYSNSNDLLQLLKLFLSFNKNVDIDSLWVGEFVYPSSSVTNEEIRSAVESMNIIIQSLDNPSVTDQWNDDFSNMKFYEYLYDEELYEIFENFAARLNDNPHSWNHSIIAEMSELDANQHMDRVMKIMAPDIQRLWNAFTTVTEKNGREDETRSMFTTLINTTKFAHLEGVLWTKPKH